ncbi:MYND domain protein [Rhizophagus clarus]|uniref:Histone-lysine N-methyltransferase SET5 n=1 Tax=Rhizophagus clarus TaxID=94130 RepID=A0A8H3LSG8_9GLOM|nr:MYND domain protein [Rhizophagus clarus]
MTHNIVEQHRKNGKDAIENKDYIKAWEEYTKGLKIIPENPVLWSNRSLACLKAGFPELAMMDAYRVSDLFNQDNIKNDESLRIILSKGNFRYAESLTALGLPRLAESAFDIVINDKLIKEDDRKKIRDRKSKLPKILSEKNYYMSREVQKGHEKFLITEDDVGFYKFNGKYPWDNRPDERTKESNLLKLQHKLDSISNNKLKLDFVKFSGDENPLIQLGVISKVDFKKNDIIMEEDPFLTIHNQYDFRCDYCLRLLEESYRCPNHSCEESFCNERCYNLAKDLYHSEICGKFIENLINYSQTRKGDVRNNNILLILKLFAIAKKRNICPLDIEEIKHFTRHHSTPHNLENHELWDADFEKVYLEILKILDISIYDLNFDFWIFITLIATIGANAFGGPAINSSSSEYNIASIYSLISLFNHNCKNNIEGQLLLRELSKSESVTIIDDFKELRRLSSSIGHHSYRMTIMANNDIKKGEQLFLSYCDSDGNNKEARHMHLLRTYGFLCYCNRCKGESDGYKPLPIAWCLYFPDDERGRDLLDGSYIRAVN